MNRIRALAIVLTCTAAVWAAPKADIAAARDAAPATFEFAQTPSLEEAVAFSEIDVTAPASWRVRLMSQFDGADYIAVLETERPVSHHSYLYERRRSGDWIAEVWRRGDGTHEQISYLHVRTGALVNIWRNEAGEPIAMNVEQHDDWTDDVRGPTGAHATHLGERCAIWRARPPNPGVLRESCLTDDGVELWTRTLSGGRPDRPDREMSRVEAISVSRGRVDPRLAQPPREIFSWAYWRERAEGAPALNEAPPADQSIWFEEEREAERGRVAVLRAWRGAHSELTHAWHTRNSSRRYELHAPGVEVMARFSAGASTGRELRVGLRDVVRPWRPDPAHVTRGETQTILGRTCVWLSPRNPPSDASWRQCWTDDNLVLARESYSRGGGYRDAAVRLDLTRQRGPLEPPREIFAWARAVTNPR